MLNEAYIKLAPLWRVVGDCYEGVEAIKRPESAFTYLPPQPAERIELESWKAFAHSRYAFRKQVASYENFFKTTVDDIVGLMSRNKPKMRFGIKNDDESPQSVLDMRFKGNRFGDGLPGLKSRINHAQTLFGRYGLLLDVVTDGDGLNPEFCITEYSPFSILDGDYFESNFDNRKKLRWALLDESTRRFMYSTKMWTDCPKRRVLGLNSEGIYYNAVWEGTDVDGTWAKFDLDNPQPCSDYELVFPTFQGEYLDFIPFTVCNVDQIGVDAWEPPPYLDVAQIAVGNYLVDSWYKMGLYQFATPTLVISNAKATKNSVRLGGVLWLNSSGSGTPSASTQILETSGGALSELRAAKQELKESLRYTSIRDLLDGAGANASGDAIKLRTASGTAAIALMDKTSARAIEEQLRFAAIWAGVKKSDVINTITYEADTTYLGQDFQLQSVIGFIQANETSRLLSKQNAYSILEKTFPDLISNFEDNEAQKLSDEDSLFTTSAPSQNPFLASFGSSRMQEPESEEDGENEEDEDAQEGKEEKQKKTREKKTETATKDAKQD